MVLGSCIGVLLISGGDPFALPTYAWYFLIHVSKCFKEAFICRSKRRMIASWAISKTLLVDGYSTLIWTGSTGFLQKSTELLSTKQILTEVEAGRRFRQPSRWARTSFGAPQTVTSPLVPSTPLRCTWQLPEVRVQRMWQIHPTPWWFRICSIYCYILLYPVISSYPFGMWVPVKLLVCFPGFLVIFLKHLESLAILGFHPWIIVQAITCTSWTCRFQAGHQGTRVPSGVVAQFSDHINDQNLEKMDFSGDY